MNDFTLNGKPLGFSADDFSRWAFSDLLSNVTRGILAEYLVAKALNIEDDNRVNWNAYDLVYRGKKIEVKSSAYIQSWNEGQHSKINFSIGKRLGWYAETNTVGELQRHADLYIFCVLTSKDRVTVNPLDLGQWDFYIVRTDDLDRVLPIQKTIGLDSLTRKFDLSPVSFEKIEDEVRVVMKIV